MNIKVNGWNSLGLDFWRHGRSQSRPSAAEIDHFLQETARGTRIAVVGGSTKGLIDAAIERGLDTTVIDFSPVMLDELAQTLPRPIDTISLDVTSGERPDGLAFDVVASDRLLNRMTAPEARQALITMLGLLSGTGTVRTSIKIGLYDIDHVFIETARRHGDLDAIFDLETNTVNYEEIVNRHPEIIPPHEAMDRQKMLEWYRFRGREKRFEHADILDMVASIEAELGRSVQVTSTPFSREQGIDLYAFAFGATQ